MIIGSFILAAAWLQARASCTPESIAAMQAQMKMQRQQEELFKRLQPEALVQVSEKKFPAIVRLSLMIFNCLHTRQLLLIAVN